MACFNMSKWIKIYQLFADSKTIKAFLNLGLRRAYDSFSKIHGGVLGSKLIRLLRESDPKRPLDFLTTNQIQYGESDFEDLMAGRRGEPTKNG